MARDWETEEWHCSLQTLSTHTLGSGDCSFLDRPARYVNVKCYEAQVNSSHSPPTGTCELCPPGWQLHRGRCYYFSEEAVSWKDSQKYCVARKSQLLVIEEETEMVSLAAALKLCDKHLP